MVMAYSFSQIVLFR